MAKWSHLPNAMHIDRILASVKAHPEVWAQARYAAVHAARHAAWQAARDAARTAAWHAARDAAWHAAWEAARDAALNAAWDAAGDAAWDAIIALIAWDYCAQYLDLSSDKLEIWTKLSEKPECLLLLSAVIAFDKISEMELTA
jgi:hypothetical protein